MSLEEWKDTVSLTATVSTICQFLVGVQVCAGFVRRKTTGESSCMTFIVGVVLTYVWFNYGRLIDDGTLKFVNGTGLFLQTCYTVCFYHFCVGKVRLTKQLVFTFAFLCMVAAYIHYETEKDKTIYNIGLLGACLSVTYCGAPLASVSHVFKNRSTEVLPYYLILVTVLVALQWSIYGTIIHDNFVRIPNMIGCVIAIFQLSLFCYFPDKKVARGAIIVS